MIARLVVKRVCRPDVRELFTDDDAPAQQARDVAAVLRAKLAEATERFLKPVGGISADRLAEIEHQLKPLIDDAERQAVSKKAPMALLELLDAAEFGKEKVRPAWNRLPTPAKREIVKLLFEKIRIGKTVHTLSRWSTAKERLTAATARPAAATPPERPGP